ncbi:hypothetical protein PsorP6_002994 [Peronosclerospora sorghi]|uniref:Uncharacterized protein n=1 Tax=Peronosclerospora sorghi TaxID=230839 RepID=A0ACC0VQ92_9STRA|nr:hypothetical protein PsorP6_002994 [Peronosclerospora sorghi]
MEMKHEDLAGTGVPVSPDVNAMTTLARMAEMMATQQHEMAQLLQHQRVVLDKLSSGRSTVEKRVEGISMPTYRGRGQAAAWFTFNQDQLTTFNELADALQAEFIPPDLQERLRAELFRLKQANCNGLEDYVSRFRAIICQVEDMSQIDQITCFVHGPVTRTREEVSYRRCFTVSNAISVALEVERSHTQPWMTRRDDRRMNLAEPVEIENVHMRQPSRKDCRLKNLCFRYKKPGHRMNDCYVKSSRVRSKDGPRRVVNSVRIRTPSLDESTMDESMSFRSYKMNMEQLKSQVSTEQENRLIRKKVLINGRERIALIDCGANHNLIRPGIVDDPGTENVASVESFDGHIRRNMRLCASTLRWRWMV